MFNKSCTLAWLAILAGLTNFTGQAADRATSIYSEVCAKELFSVGLRCQLRGKKLEKYVINSYFSAYRPASPEADKKRALRVFQRFGIGGVYEGMRLIDRQVEYLIENYPATTPRPVVPAEESPAASPPALPE